MFQPSKLINVEHIEQIKEEIETRKKMIQCLQDPNRRITSSSESFRVGGLEKSFILIEVAC